MATKRHSATGEGKAMSGYELGAMVWFHGYEYIIIGEPFQLHGGMVQRARRYLGYPDGKTVVVPIPEQKAADIARNQKEHADQQAGFSRLKALKAERAGQ